MKVRNMLSPQGNYVANQFVITDNGTEYFQSYESTIAMRNPDGKIFLDEHYWNYSGTTAKYRRIFLDEGVDATRAKINSGEYILANLNKED